MQGRSHIYSYIIIYNNIYVYMWNILHCHVCPMILLALVDKLSDIEIYGQFF